MPAIHGPGCTGPTTCGKRHVDVVGRGAAFAAGPGATGRPASAAQGHRAHRA
ncbi:hypothetical protein GF314_11825 [bacterium]|nr:hypothetical protein [bacterium]